MSEGTPGSDEAMPLIPLAGREVEGVLPRVLDQIRARTPARVMVGRAGGSYRTKTSLKLRGDHAAARDAVIADRRKNPRNDLVSLLVQGTIDGEGLTDEQLLQESLLILIGGDETTRHVMTGGLEQLILHPDQKRKLIDDPGKIEIAVEEMIRWVSPIVNMNRTLTRDTVLHGEKLREGDRVLLLYPAANRDERAFENPDRFDVERWPNYHVAFGGYGVHHCLGASLARLELKILFEELLARLPDIRLASDEPLERRPNNFITGIEKMPVVFTPSRASA